MGSIINTTFQNSTCDRTNCRVRAGFIITVIIAQATESRPETSKLVKEDAYRVRFPFGQSSENLAMRETQGSAENLNPALEPGSWEGLGVTWGRDGLSALFFFLIDRGSWIASNKLYSQGR